MKNSWQNLMGLVSGRSFRIERVRLIKSGIAIEGDFNPPNLIRLSQDDQTFAAMFIACHGSIKKMERLLGISYPTVKNRLNAIASKLDVPSLDVVSPSEFTSRSDVFDQLERGEISFEEAIKELQ